MSDESLIQLFDFVLSKERAASDEDEPGRETEPKTDGKSLQGESASRALIFSEPGSLSLVRDDDRGDVKRNLDQQLSALAAVSSRGPGTSSSVGARASSVVARVSSGVMREAIDDPTAPLSMPAVQSGDAQFEWGDEQPLDPTDAPMGLGLPSFSSKR